MIDPGIGANKTQAMLDDERSRARTQHFFAFPKDQLDKPGIFIDAVRQIAALRGWFDGIKVNHPAFGFGNNFLRQNQDITIQKLNVVCPQRMFNQTCQIITGLNQRETLEGS